MIRSGLILTALTLALTLPEAASANTLRRACETGERPGGRQLCRCIQNVADQTLSGREQRQAAQFFSDPQRAQDVRMSKRTADNHFWDRYKRFAGIAERSCS